MRCDWRLGNLLAMIAPKTNRSMLANGENRSNLLTRNARFLWLAAVFVPPGAAFLTYILTPHEAIWHDVLYSLFCLPLFAFFLLAVLGCVLSFLIHRVMSRS
jgi:hypothetical protein